MAILIPKTIHYCWFGGNPLPKDAQKCIASWRKYMPDHEIVVWNEDNFDVNICKYVTEAYKQKKYAFVSDYARFWILYNHGGLYFDTDVELLCNLDALLANGPFMGIEKSLATNGSDPQGMVGVNPGLGMGAVPKMDILKEILDYYDNISFDINDGTVVYHTTKALEKHGFKNLNELQTIAGITIYPDDVLCPMDSTTGIVTKTPRTVSIHHYACSWIDHNTLSFRLHLLKNFMIKIFGQKAVLSLSKLFR